MNGTICDISYFPNDTTAARNAIVVTILDRGSIRWSAVSWHAIMSMRPRLRSADSKDEIIVTCLCPSLAGGVSSFITTGTAINCYFTSSTTFRFLKIKPTIRARTRVNTPPVMPEKVVPTFTAGHVSTSCSAVAPAAAGSALKS